MCLTRLFPKFFGVNRYAMNENQSTHDVSILLMHEIRNKLEIYLVFSRCVMDCTNLLCVIFEYLVVVSRTNTYCVEKLRIRRVSIFL